jgi:hypothetical protein
MNQVIPGQVQQKQFNSVTGGMAPKKGVSRSRQGSQ